MQGKGNFRSYAIAIVAAATGLALRLALTSVFGAVSPSALFVPVVAFSAWYGGFLPGMSTALLLMLAGIASLDSADGANRRSEEITLAAFALSSIAICMVVRELRAARGKAEEHATAAEEAERSLQAVLESTLDSVASLDREFRCIYVNENAARLAGLRASEIIGKTMWELFPALRGGGAESALLEALRTAAPTRFEQLYAPGNQWFECSVYPAGNGVHLFVRDITAHKNTEGAIEAENKRLAAVLHDMPIAVLIVSRDLMVEISNPRANALFGREIQRGDDFRVIRAGTLRTPEGGLLAPSELPVVRTLREGSVLSNLAMEYERGDGVTFALIVNCIPLKADDGSVRAVLATFSDVTSLHATQAALVASEHRLRYLFNSPSMGIISGENENITNANPAFLAMLGYSQAEFLSSGIRWDKITAPEFAPRDGRAQLEVMQKGFCDPYEKEYIARDGRRVPILMGAVSASPGTWTPWVVWVLDLSERRRLEERLRQTAKLESVGILAGGVAHDFNNLLTGILGNTSLAADRLPVGDETRELLTHAIRITEKAAGLTRQLLAYAGKGQFVIRQVDLSSLVRETMEFVKGSLPRGAQCRLELNPQLPLVEADATQIQQIVMNLIINAGEAMGEAGGWIDIATGAVELNAPPDNNLLPGNYAYIRVQDTGCGMDEATRRRLFDPFFTTKFTGRGLGLAAALGIARSHHGAIEVTTTVGVGSTFRVLLPIGTRGTRDPLQPEEAAPV